LSLIEALALGVPVIATRCGSGVEEVLRGGAFGLLVDRDSPRALADAVEHHLRNPAPLRARARMAAAHVARYDSRETARRFLAALGAPPPERGTRAASPGREERAASRR
ncbi:MAG: glycosyltransferase, partial [Thermoleophilia bacterium]|nr:glycosyltransferase [Thermoleophilia bacterium]